MPFRLTNGSAAGLKPRRWPGREQELFISPVSPEIFLLLRPEWFEKQEVLLYEPT